MYADSHCHLDHERLGSPQHEVIARARTAGVTAMLNISTHAAEWDRVIATAEREPDVWASIGVHPDEADQHASGDRRVDAAMLVARAAHPRVIAIGETGLDYHHDHCDRERQRANFRVHIEAAVETGLPIVIHMRDAEDDAAAILREGRAGGRLRGVIHCFTASDAFADQALDLGFFLSFSGIVTFKNADGLRATAARIPADRLLIETDAPFLAPVPHRGRPGEPAFVVDTARVLAGLRGVDPAALAAETCHNFHVLFQRAAGQAQS